MGSEVAEYELLAVHSTGDVREFTAPGEDIDAAVNSEKAIRMESELRDEHGGDGEGVIVPAATPPDHPLVTAADERLPSLGLADILREHGTGEPAGYQE